jgi:hypothetical protein
MTDEELREANDEPKLAMWTQRCHRCIIRSSCAS